MPIPQTELGKRLIRWMLPHEQPARLALEHPVQEDIAAAIDEIERLSAKAGTAPPTVRCSECDNGVQDDWTYCPYCGAQGRSETAIERESA